MIRATTMISATTMIRKTLIHLVCLIFASSAFSGQALVRYDRSDALSQYGIDKNVFDLGVRLINDTFVLERTLHIRVGGQEGPLFDPATMEILMPSVFVAEVMARFQSIDYEKTGVRIPEATEDALLHTLFHEFAHAIIAMYELPVLGKEEDAADSLASVLLIEFFENGAEIALSAADLFDIESDDREVLTDEDFWGEHSLDDQRYFATLCHVYGSDPAGYKQLEKTLSIDRAEACVAEYENVRASWFTLLEPYLKTQLD